MPRISRNDQKLVNAHIEALQRRNSLKIPSDAGLGAMSAQLWTLPSLPSTQIVNLAISMTRSDDLHDEQCDQLLPVYRHIVATLTELSNTECMRSDEQERRQVQEKLMEVQQKCREQQRLRLSRTKRDLALAISSQVKLDVET